MDNTQQLMADPTDELNALRRRVVELEAIVAARSQHEAPPDEFLLHLQPVLDSMPLGGIVIDSDLRISYWNTAAEKIFGFTAAEVLGKLHYEVTVPAYAREYVSDVVQRTAQGDVTTFGENDNKTKAGNIIVCEWHNTPLRDAAGRYVGILAMAQDITDRKQAESQREAALAALRDSEDLFKYVFDSSSVGKSITYLSGKTRVNEALCNMLGYTLEEYQDRRWQAITHPDDVDLTQREINALLVGEKTAARFAKRFIHKNGSIVWVDLSSSLRRDQNGQPLYLISTLVDITERQQAELQREAALEALRNSEEKYRDLFENMNDAFALHKIILDENGRPIDYEFLDVNPEFAKRLGLAPADLINKRALELFPQTESAWIEAFGEVALTGHPLHFTNYAVELDKHFDTRIYCPRPGYFAAIFTDITERKRVEEALRESEERWRTVVEAEPECVKVLDSAGQIVMMNPAGLAMIQATLEEVRGERASSLVVLEDRASFDEMVQVVFRGESRHLVFDMIGLKGRRLTLETVSVPLWDPAEKNRVKFLVGITRDVTERKRAEEALRESDERYRATVEQSNDGITIADQSGRYVMVNTAFCSMIGYTQEELLQMRVTDLLPAETALQLFPQISEARRSGQRETELVRKDGSRVIVSITGSPLSIRNESYVQGIVQDITERKRAEEQLLRAQKLESLGILAGGVAHDFNNLLVALLGQTSLAAAKLPPDHPAQQHLARASMAARRAADLTRQMLAYSGRGAFQMTPLNLNTLIRDNASFLESSIAKTITLRTSLTETLPLINADAGQMQQIIMNLVLNAAEALGERVGTIDITTSVIDVASDDRHWTHYTGQAVAANRYVQLRVQDTGNGMSAETLGRIFDPFFTTKFTGRGLGLAAVLGIVRGHRGGLWVESEIGRGTAFTLIFPVTSDEEAAIATPSQSVLSSQRVLVIDDEEPVLEAIADMLALDHIGAVCTASATEGIALFRKQQANIGLVLLDLSMPGLSGRQVFDALKELDPNVRVVLTSGYTQAEATQGFAGRQLAGFLQKPYDMDTLLETVRQHLARKPDE